MKYKTASVCIPASFVKQARKYIEETVGIPAEQVMLNCTHTHSGPDPSKLGQGNMKAWQLLIKKAVRESLMRTSCHACMRSLLKFSM